MVTIYDDDAVLKKFNDFYGLTILNGCRCYEYITSKHYFDMTGSSPYCIEVYSNKIFSESWSKLLFSFLAYLDSLVYKTNDELLKIKNDELCKRNIFTSSIRKGDKSFTEFRPGLFFHNAVDANFAVAIIYSLLDAYDIDLGDVSLYIRLSQRSEPLEVRNFVIEKNKTFFLESLLSLQISGINEMSIDEIINFADYLSNKYLVSSNNHGFDLSLFLFDNYDDFNRCKDNLLKDLERNRLFASVDFSQINWSSDDEPQKETTPEEARKFEEKKKEANHELDFGKKILEYFDYYYMMLDDLSSLDY